MIDTVVIRLHNLKSKYEYYAKVLRMLRTPEGDVIRYAARPLDKDSVKNYRYFADRDKVSFLGVRSKHYVASSHYSINCFENYERDFIEVNVSVPKYVFGTNVFQFVDKPDETPWHVWTKFERWIRDLFLYLFPGLPDYSDVEINRIDMCFNQVFRSKEAALKYLSNQKEMQVKWARSERNRFSSYGSTTIQSNTDDYSFKIYHKGTEFMIKDFKELDRRNPRNYSLKELSEVADRMLRYEVTFRKGAINYVWKQKVKNDPNSNFGRNLMRMHLAKTRAYRDFILEDLNKKSFGFRLATEWDKPAGSLRAMYDGRVLTFNSALFSSLWEFFMKRVRAYQFESRLTVADVNARLRAHAERKKALRGKTFDVSSMLVISVLSQYTDIRKLKGVIPDATYYRYLKNLREAEIPVNNEVDVEPGALDFSEYWYLLGKYHIEYN